MSEDQEVPARRKLVQAIADYYLAAPRPKQIALLLGFMAVSAIIFQIVHGFDLICDYSSKTGVPLCVATSPHWDTAAANKRRAESEAKFNAAISVLAKVSLDLDTLKSGVKDEKLAINLLAAKTGNANWLKKQLHPKIEDIFSPSITKGNEP